MKKGISLILLVITIIIIIILSGSIILTILPNNVISDSKATVQKADFKTISDEFNLYKSNLYTKTDGKFDMTTINADSTNIGTICKTAEKYKDIFKIVNGNLEYTGNNSTEKALAKEYSMIYYGTEKTGTNISINNSLESTIPSLTIYGKSTQNIPSGYTFYDYIISSGTQYIDTGFIPNQNTSVEIDCEPNLAYKWLFGSRLVDPNSIDKFGIHINPTSMYPQYGGQSNSNVVVSNVFDRAIHKLSKNIYSINGITKHTFTVTTFSGTYSLYLLGMHQSSIDSRNFSGKIYSSKIWDNGSLVRNMIPAKRTSDNVIGMYDVINNMFYTNAGTGVFTVGTEINLPIPNYPIVINSTNNFNIFSSGKNILNFKGGDLVNCTAEYLDNGVILKSTSTTGYLRIPILLIKGKNYKMSFNSTRTGSTGGGYYSTTSSGQLITGSANSLNAGYGDIASSSTTNYDIVYIRLYANNGGNVGDSATFTNIQLEQNSVATEYTKYISILSANINSTLRAIMVANNSTTYSYQDTSGNRYITDYIEMKNGKVNLVKNIEQTILNGSENWYKITGYDNATNIVFRMDFARNNYFSMCDKLNVIYAGLNSVNTPTYAPSFVGNTISINKSLLVGYNDSLTDSQKVTLFKSWISTNNIKIQYVLNTPVITDITNTPEGQSLLNIRTQKGYTNIYDTSGLDLWKKIVVKEK